MLSAINGMALAGILIAGGSMIGGFDPTGMIEDILFVCGAIIMVFGLIALMGAIMALMGKSWGLAVLGGVFGLFTLGPFLLLGSIFGLIGLILVAMSKDEFGPQQPPYGAPPPGYPMGQPPMGQPPMQPPPGQPPMQPPEQPPMQPPQEPPQY